MYYHINDIIFLVRFPQFVGSLRRDVWTTAYWRGHPPATSPLSARTLTLSFRLSSSRHPGFLVWLSRQRLVSLSFKVPSQLTNRFYRRQMLALDPRLHEKRVSLSLSVSLARFVSRARTKSKLVFDLMAMHNYASQPYIAYACTANWPGQARAVRRVHFNY